MPIASARCWPRGARCAGSGETPRAIRPARRGSRPHAIAAPVAGILARPHSRRWGALMSSIPTSRVSILCALSLLTTLATAPLSAAEPTKAAIPANDPVAVLVARLDLERYKATIKGLTRFGDRRQGTD